MLVTIIVVIRQTLYLLILVKVVLSYFMDPYHPFRQAVDRLVDPLLWPIRQVVPTMGRFDFSPLILLLLVEFISRLLLSIL
ncbi:MAG: YggT family protein [Anaerolineales bacterium]|jgi:YggT family protein